MLSVLYFAMCLVVVLTAGCDIRDIERDSIECRRIYDGAYASDAIRTEHVRHKYTNDTLEVEIRFTSRHTDTLVTVLNYLRVMIATDHVDVEGSSGYQAFACYFLRLPRDTVIRHLYVSNGETNVFKDSSIAVQLLRLPPKATVNATIRIPPEETNFVERRGEYLHRLVFMFREVDFYFRETPGAPLESINPLDTLSVILNPVRSSVDYLRQYYGPIVTTPDPKHTLYVTRQFFAKYLQTAEPHRAVVEF
jgi:hypothetical protein